MFYAHVEAHFESAHRNGPPGHKCAGTFTALPVDVAGAVSSYFAGDPDPALVELLRSMFDYHGHSWLGEIEWSYDESKLDEDGWGPDFGKVKQIIRQYDHHNLNLFMAKPSAENLAKAIYEEFTQAFGFEPELVRLHEGAGNTMTYYGPGEQFRVAVV